MNSLDRKKAIPKLLGDTDRFLIISGLAGPAKDIGFLTKESPIRSCLEERWEVLFQLP